MRVVIADDAALVREGVALLLAENGIEVIARVADGQARPLPSRVVCLLATASMFD